jgi:hypothetical protein
MSAQIIDALRYRAADLRKEARELDAAGVSELPDQDGRSVYTLRFLADEFEKLAEYAQANRSPRDGF